jgi:prepilin-type N-terminal cleavage/methylation domain-containing protein
MVCPTRFKNNGFSLVEVIVVVGLLAFFGSVVGPVYKTVQTKGNLDIATVGTVSAIRRAQVAAESGNADSAWGVKISATSTIVFAGNSFDTRNVIYDEKIDMPSSITVSGTSEIIFSKFSGLPQPIGTTTLTSLFGSKNIILNNAGTISY